MINIGSELQTHVAMQGMLQFIDENGRQPKPNDAADTAAVVACAKALVASGAVALPEVWGAVPEIDEAHITKFARHCSVELQPMGAFLGGVTAQEVIKFTGKFTPLPSMMHFAALESLPEEQPSADSTAATGTRFDDLAAVYGREFITTLGNLRYFMVGCGALGCEFLKNFALNNICCGQNGSLTVTDNDRIELSNLSRQFLFREDNVGQPKSRAAGVKAKEMNPNFHVESLEMFVGPNTEDTFDDDFWMGLDGVCNALDNMEARMYVDGQVVKYELPLLESGTMGTSGNVDPVVPFKTKSYEDGGKAAEDGGIPMCTLRNFPHLPDHCIEWARDQFEALFVKLGKQANKYVDDPAAFEGELRGSTDKTQAIFDARTCTAVLRACAAPSLNAAAQLAFDLFHMLFRDKITDLTTAFPRDARTLDKAGQDKGAFWSGHKKFPSAASYDGNNETHWRFMVDTTNLFAAMIGVVPPKEENDSAWCAGQRSCEWINGVVAQLSVLEYVATPVNTDGDDEANATEKVDADSILEGLLTNLRSIGATKASLPEFFEADFEKDDDLNFHIDFITRAANLRADNYSITNTDFQKAKIIAGRIIPAIATTTAAVTGLVMLELFKTVLQKSADDMLNRSINLGTNVYTSFTQDPPRSFKTRVEKTEPSPADVKPEMCDETGKLKPEYIMEETQVAYPDGHSKWDKLDAGDGDQTLGDFKVLLKEKHALDLVSWNFVLGHQPTEIEGKKVPVPVSCKVFPPDVKLDPANLPALDLAANQAMMAIMRNQQIPQPQKMKYNALWKECVANGALPDANAGGDDGAITLESKMLDIFKTMEQKADEKVAAGEMKSKAISNIGRRAVLVLPSDGLACRNDDFEDIFNMAALRFKLK